MLKSGMIIGNRYEILNRIGSGGMSTVYKGRDQKLNRCVAIKVLKSEYREDKNFIRRFREEAQAAACLAHPNIVNVYDVGEEDGIYYIVMELVEGITLKNYIERKGKLTIKEASSIAIQVSMGLEVAHNNEIVHRDIKPQNIMISKEGKVKVMDFGIAKAATSETISSNAMGSVHYTSPEQARGGYSDAKSDIYSLGIVMYEMVTGRVPFDGDTTVAVAVKHLQEQMVSPREYCPEIPRSLEQIIYKCTEKAPAKRYANMAELIADLKQSLLTPDADFVKRIDIDEAAKTVMITKSDLSKIKSETGRVVLSEPEEKRNIFEEYEEKASAADYLKESEKEEPDDEDEEDEDDEEEMDPRMEKILTIGGIVTAIIIVIMIILLAGKILGFGTSKKPGNTNQSNQEETVKDVEVPGVVGMTWDEAKKTLNGLGLGIGIVAEGGYEASEEYEDGQIIRQSIQKGDKVAANTTIEVVVCDNKSLKVEIPNVVGKSKEDAKAALEEKGFKVEFSEINDSSAEAGKVLKTSPSEGTKLSKGQTVVVTVSLGTKKVTVPDLRGKTQDQARKALEDAGLNIGNVSQEYSSEYEKGIVMKQTASAGTEAAEGSSVGITVSKGKEQVKVPAVIGVESGVAKERIDNAGLKFALEEAYSSKYAKGMVISCEPGENSSVDPGSTVKIVISLGEKVVTYKYSGTAKAPSEAAKDSEFTVILKDGEGTTLASGTGAVGTAVEVQGTGIKTSAGTLEIKYVVEVQGAEGTVQENKSVSYAVEFTAE
ncbi:MAG: Stk1 family PASTA domain-containing Ser/Thr kinase [Lachnospiraceae bacterium]